MHRHLGRCVWAAEELQRRSWGSTSVFPRLTAALEVGFVQEMGETNELPVLQSLDALLPRTPFLFLYRYPLAFLVPHLKATSWIPLCFVGGLLFCCWYSLSELPALPSSSQGSFKQPGKPGAPKPLSLVLFPQLLVYRIQLSA